MIHLSVPQPVFVGQKLLQETNKILNLVSAVSWTGALVLNHKIHEWQANKYAVDTGKKEDLYPNFFGVLRGVYLEKRVFRQTSVVLAVITSSCILTQLSEMLVLSFMRGPQKRPRSAILTDLTYQQHKGS